MAFTKFGADKVFDGEEFLPQNTVVIVDSDGTIEALVPASEAGDAVQHLDGILLPGLINAHCHLELSHFKEKIAPGGGLVSFLFSVLEQRKNTWQPETVQQAIQAAADEMWNSGIVAVADISNGTDAIKAKQRSAILWYNLVEVLIFSEQTFAQRWQTAQEVLKKYFHEGMDQTVITPHAPYSVTPQTFRRINESTAGKTISLHNQETAAENQLFRHGTGDFSRLYELTNTAGLGGLDCSSLQAWLPYFDAGQTIVAVHNTFIQKEDIHFAKRHEASAGVKLFYCLCPYANQYIEDRLPPLPMLAEEGCPLLLGTDSYSSNYQLSIAAEMALLHRYFPQVPLSLLLKAATANGADAFGWNDLGRLQKRKKSGLALLHLNKNGTLKGTSEKIHTAP